MKESLNMMSDSDTDHMNVRWDSVAGVDGRRKVLVRLLLGWLFFIFLPAIYIIARYLLPPKAEEVAGERVDVGNMSTIPDISSGPLLLRSRGKAVYIYRNAQKQVKAFSGVCTHLGCLVEYSRDQHRFKCNCHGSEFDLTGKNITGPALIPLQPYRVVIEHGEVFISKAATS
jgi:Rieske Fe-S protein